MPAIDPADMITGSPLAGWSGRFFHSANMTFAHWDIAADAVPLHEHQHDNEEVWNVTMGEIVLTIDGADHRLGSGSAAIVPPNTLHSATPAGPCQVIVTDHPVRHDLPGVTSTD